MQNIILIGMPGSGKSTVGVLLAKQVALDFVDTDVLIQTSQQRTLQAIVDADGQAELRKIEEGVLLGLTRQSCVIATGGSAVYSDKAMRHLKSAGVVVFLDVDLATLEARVQDFTNRGLAKDPDQSFAQLFDERLPLYKKHADITVQGAGLNPDDLCAEIVAKLRTVYSHASGLRN
ncbi:MAG: shikimate kinase [Moraxellaceae bacterium]|nr:shikimate kinase [Moraxellaceae bacterium]MDZ4386289.1 shikimate kinase [Moraxellaceae bacterium]